jgi:hypothetical protein
MDRQPPNQIAPHSADAVTCRVAGRQVAYQYTELKRS